MPTPSNPPTPTDANPAPRRTPRLPHAARALKILTTLILLTFVCTYARTALHYSASPRPQITASLAKPSPQTFFPPTHIRPAHRRQAFFRPAHHLKRHARQPTPFYLASMRRLRRLFSQLLVVRS